MNEQESSLIVNSSIKANTTIVAKIRFKSTEIEGNRIPLIEINCMLPTAYTYPFIAKFENLILKL
jgi:hypothetical protein